MVEFLTLLISLTLGPQHIELAVQEPVVAVEILVDGKSLDKLDGPPWQVGIDFGKALLPRQLEAVGFDANGQEITRVSQNINFGRANQDATLVLENVDGQGKARQGKVVWRAVKNWEPSKIEVKLDGKPLEVEPDGRFLMPNYDEDEVHVLEAQITFPPRQWTDSSASRRAPLPSADAYDFQGNMAQRRPQYYTRRLEEEKTQVPGQTIEAHLVFGKQHGLNSSATLTALPVQWVAGFEPPGIEAMKGWFQHRETQPDIFSISEEPGEIFIVFEHKMRKKVATVIKKLADQLGEETPRGWSQDPTAYFIATTPSVDRGASVFPSYKVPASRVASGFLDTLAHPTTRAPRRGIQALVWDAITLAGRRAAQSNRTRIVLAIFDPTSEDVSNLLPYQAAGYLKALHVPLLIWTPEPTEFEGIEKVPHYVGPYGLLALAADLQSLFDRQQIIWLEGDLIPHRIQLTQEAPQTVTLVGR